jgi:hypothetical protein
VDAAEKPEMDLETACRVPLARQPVSRWTTGFSAALLASDTERSIVQSAFGHTIGLIVMRTHALLGETFTLLTAVITAGLTIRGVRRATVRQGAVEGAQRQRGWPGC